MRDFVLEILENNETVHAFSGKNLSIIFNDIKNYNSSKNEYYILQFWDKTGHIKNILETDKKQDLFDLDIYYILEIYKNKKLFHAYGSFDISNLNKINYNHRNESYSLVTKINSEFFEFTKKKNIINKYINGKRI